MEVPSPQTLAVVPSWIEAHCIVPDGFHKGQPFRLYDYQLQYMAAFYLVRNEVQFDAANPILGPAFVHRRGLLVGPQKLGKNPMIATQVCAEGVGPVLFSGWAGKDDGYACADHGCACGWEYAYDAGEPMGMAWPTPLIQITAFSEESTDNTYDALRPMIDEGPLHDLIPRTGEEFIRLPGGGRIDTVTSSNQSRLGQRVTFVPQDEVGLWTAQAKMVKLADTQHRNLAGMGGRASMTTNAWDPSEHSVAQQQYESAAVDIYRQFIQAPKTLHYTDRRDRAKIHRSVYPPDVRRENGGHLDLDGIERDAADLVERDPAQAARFYGNRLEAGGGRAIDPEAWAGLARGDGPPPDGTYIGLGFDGSISGDATILRGCTAAGYSFAIGAWVRPLGPLGNGWEVDRLSVDSLLREAFSRWRVGRMYADPPKWRTELQGWAREYGEAIVLAFDTNQDRRMAPAVDRWQTAILTGTHTHDGDPIATAHVENVHKRKARATASDTDERTLYTLTKGDEGGKIDAAVADVLCYEAAMTMPSEPALERERVRAFLA